MLQNCKPWLPRGGWWGGNLQQTGSVWDMRMGSQENHLCISCPVSCDVMTQEVAQDDGLSKSSSGAESYTIVLSGVCLSTEICRTKADSGLSQLCPQIPVYSGAGWPLELPLCLYRFSTCEISGGIQNLVALVFFFFLLPFIFSCLSLWIRCIY